MQRNKEVCIATQIQEDHPAAKTAISAAQGCRSALPNQGLCQTAALLVIPRTIIAPGAITSLDWTTCLQDVTLRHSVAIRSHWRCTIIPHPQERKRILRTSVGTCFHMTLLLAITLLCQSVGGICAAHCFTTSRCHGWDAIFPFLSIVHGALYPYLMLRRTMQGAIIQ